VVVVVVLKTLEVGLVSCFGRGVSNARIGGEGGRKEEKRERKGGRTATALRAANGLLVADGEEDGVVAAVRRGRAGGEDEQRERTSRGEGRSAKLG
jgi:hypothetical protein